MFREFACCRNCGRTGPGACKPDVDEKPRPRQNLTAVSSITLNNSYSAPDGAGSKTRGTPSATASIHDAPNNLSGASIQYPCVSAVYLLADGAFLAGSFVAYAWYLFVHHCIHHSVDRLPAVLIKNHNGHHRFATRNFGVTSLLSDRFFRNSVAVIKSALVRTCH